MIKRVPLPICSVALGLAALGNLLQSYSEGVRMACGILSAILLALFLIKCVTYPKLLAEDMKNPIMASVSGTFSMALMLLSVYIKPLIGGGVIALWYIAIGLHVALIVCFTSKFMLKLQMPKVLASYFIVYVGIAAAGVTAPAFEQQEIGTAAFWFGFVTLLALLVLVTVRYIRYREIPVPAKPLICIYAAPASLCVAAYVQSVTPKSFGFLMVLYALSGVLFLFGLVQAVRNLKLPFFPSYGAFTFPFVISAIASKQTMACAAKLDMPQPWLQAVVLAQTVIATLLVAYTLIRFLMFIFQTSPAKQ